MNALEAEGLAGAGLTPAIERLKYECSFNESTIELQRLFARNLLDLLTRCRDTLEAQSEAVAALQADKAELLAALVLMCRSRGSPEPIPSAKAYDAAYAAISKHWSES